MAEHHGLHPQSERTIASVAEALNIEPELAMRHIIEIGGYIALRSIEGMDILQGNAAKNDLRFVEFGLPERQPGPPKLRVVK